MGGGVVLLLLAFAGVSMIARGIAWVVRPEAETDAGDADAGTRERPAAARLPRWLGAGLIAMGGLALAAAAAMPPGRQVPWGVARWRPLLAACLASMSVALFASGVRRRRASTAIAAAAAMLIAATLLVPPETLEAIAYRLTGDARFRPPR